MLLYVFCPADIALIFCSASADIVLIFCPALADVVLIFCPSLTDTEHADESIKDKLRPLPSLLDANNAISLERFGPALSADSDHARQNPGCIEYRKVDSVL